MHVSAPTFLVLPFVVLGFLPSAAHSADFWASGSAAGTNEHQPIRVVIDFHVDPVTASVAAQEVQYAEWLTVADWVMDQIETTDAKVSFTTGGWFAERASKDATGAGNALLKRIYDRGRQIGTHFHGEHRASDGTWPALAPAASSTDVAGAWKDNLDWVTTAVRTAVPAVDPAKVNRVLGAHIPKTESEFHALMKSNGLTIRQPGPEEDYYFWFNHYIWNPYRPSPANYLNEDPGAEFVQTVQGSVIGKTQKHHGALHDQSASQMKRQFLQAYINWDYQRVRGFTPRVWVYGWGSHVHDFEPDDPADAGSRSALTEMLQWIQKNFATRTTSDGKKVMRWDTHLGVADALTAWEAAHPGVAAWVSETGCDPSIIEGATGPPKRDWSKYPYLEPVALEMEKFGVARDLNLGVAGVTAFALKDNSGNNAVVAWKSSLPAAVVDLSRALPGKARIVDLYTGISTTGSTASVSVGATPIIVTTRAEPTGS